MQRRGNYIYLLISLLVLIIMAAIIARRLDQAQIFTIELAFTVTLFIGIWSLLGNRTWFLFGLLLVVAGIANTVAMVFLQIPMLRFVAIGIMFLFFLFTTIIAIHDVMSSESVNINEIVGAMCSYLLLGFIWTMIYLFLNAVSPGSFNGISMVSDGTTLSDFVYYSFVTLTSLGYGDITPVTPIARALSYLEAIIGQFYIAVLVATLVGIHVSRRRSK